MQTDVFKEETDVCFKEVVMSIIVFSVFHCLTSGLRWTFKARLEVSFIISC